MAKQRHTNCKEYFTPILLGLNSKKYDVKRIKKMHEKSVKFISKNPPNVTPRNKSAAGGADDVQPGLQQSHGEPGQQETQA